MKKGEDQLLARVEAALRHFGVNAEKASREAGLDKDFIRNIRRGKSKSPRTQGLRALANRFQCSLEWLSGDNKASPPAWSLSDDFDSRVMPVASEILTTGMAKIQEMALDASSGAGALVSTDSDLPVRYEWQLPADFLRRATDSPASAIKIISVKGNSMEPLFFSTDRVMVDINDKTPTPPGVFVVYDGLGLVLKTVQFLPNSDPPRVRISSENPKYEPYERTLDEAYIQGRVLGKWQWT